MGWLITLGIVVLLAILPLGASIKYDADGPLVKLIAGPVKVTLFPRPKKPKKERNPKSRRKLWNRRRSRYQHLQKRLQKNSLPQLRKNRKRRNPVAL